MIIGLNDVDKTRFPNLALMKLSAWHKAQGDTVEIYNKDNKYDYIYSSKVFTYTKESNELASTANVIRGGSGYANPAGDLPLEVEHIMPDYSLYDLDYSVGFLTRGCNRKCNWCIVPSKEGKTKKNADIDEFLAHKNVVFLDNNVLQHEHGIEQLKKIATMDIKIDFNQGIDARMITPEIATLFGKIKWYKPVRLACDHYGMMKSVGKAVELLRYHNVTPSRYFCYCLVKDIDDALKRIKFLKGIYVDPFAQPYIAFDGTSEPSKIQRGFARWVNHKAIFKSMTWEEYKELKGLPND